MYTPRRGKGVVQSISQPASGVLAFSQLTMCSPALQLRWDSRSMPFTQIADFVLAVLWFPAVLAGLSGCSGGADRLGFRDPHDLICYMNSGFDKSVANLFVDRAVPGSESKLRQLVAHLGHDANEFSGAWDHSSDGTRLRLWNADRSRVLIIAKDRPPRAIATPVGAHLNDRDEVVRVRHTSMDAGCAYFSLQMFGPPDPQTGIGEKGPTRLFAASAPDKPLVVSSLDPARTFGTYLFSAPTEVFLLARVLDADKGGLDCEVYRRHGEGLTFDRRLRIPCPAVYSAVWVQPIDFNPRDGNLLVTVKRDAFWLPDLFLCNIYGDRSWKRVGPTVRMNAHAAFLDYEVFSGLASPAGEPQDESGKARRTGESARGPNETGG